MRLIKRSFFLTFCFLLTCGILWAGEPMKQNLTVQFDVPKLLKMDIKQIKKELGKPQSEFKPSAIQLKIDPDILSNLDYQKGTTNLIIDYAKNGKVRSVFISDKTEGRTKDEILKLGNLDFKSKDYKVRIQKWLNPEYAKRNKKAEIAGIEVKPLDDSGLVGAIQLKQSHVDHIKRLEKQGKLLIKPKMNTAYISPLYWHSLSAISKKNLAELLAIYSGNIKHNDTYWVEIFDASTGKKIARYSKSRGFKVY